MFKTIMMAFQFIISTYAFAEPSAPGARTLAVMVYSAELCQIAVTPAIKEWTSAMLKDVPEYDRNIYRGLAVKIQITSKDGPIGYCYKLRSDLFRDGWIAG